MHVFLCVFRKGNGVMTHCPVGRQSQAGSPALTQIVIVAAAAAAAAAVSSPFGKGND
jgi:hypothetical protein